MNGNDMITVTLAFTQFQWWAIGLPFIAAYTFVLVSGVHAAVQWWRADRFK
jgi:hypothetical protein